MKYKVYIMEYERGWGSKVDETLEFDTQEEQEKYIKEYNEKYNPPMPFGQAPDWYMVAVK